MRFTCRTDCSQTFVSYFMAENESEILLLNYVYNSYDSPLYFTNAVSSGDWRQLKSIDITFVNSDDLRYTLPIIAETAEEQRFLKKLSEGKVVIKNKKINIIHGKTWLFIDFVENK